MAFEFKRTNFTNKKKVSAGEFVTTGKFKIEGDNVKVIKVVAEPKVTGTEQVADGLNYYGKCQVSIVYQIGEDVSVLAGQIDWQNKADVAGLTDVTIVPTIKDTNFVCAEEITINCLISVEAVGFVEENILQLEPTDELVTKSKMANICKVIANGNEEFNVSEEFDAITDAKNILLTQTTACVKNCFAGIDQITIEGNLFAHMLVKTDEDIINVTKEIPFKQEVACFGATVGANCLADVYVTEVTSTLLEDGEVQKVNLTVSIKGLVTAFANEELEVVADVYSCTHKTQTTTEMVAVENIDNNSYLENTATATIDVENYVNFDEVKAVYVSKIDKAEIKQENGVNMLNSFINLEVVYKTTDGKLICTNNLVDLSSKLSGEFNTLSKISAQVSTFKLRGTHELEVYISLNTNVCNVTTHYVDFVSGIELLSEEFADDAGIKMVVAKESEELFDIGRILHVRPETLLEQNENLDKINAGDKIFVYVPQTIQFN